MTHHTAAPTRTETDSLGSMEIPADAYWGIHTARALENFPISRRPISVYADLVRALAMVKQAAARANAEIGVLDREKAALIDRASQLVIDGGYHDQHGAIRMDFADHVQKPGLNDVQFAPRAKSVLRLGAEPPYSMC